MEIIPHQLDLDLVNHYLNNFTSIFGCISIDKLICATTITYNICHGFGNFQKKYPHYNVGILWKDVSSVSTRSAKSFREYMASAITMKTELLDMSFRVPVFKCLGYIWASISSVRSFNALCSKYWIGPSRGKSVVSMFTLLEFPRKPL